MDFFSNFLQQKVPKSGKELPVYYRKALCVSEILLIAYFFVCFFFYPLFLDVWIWFPLGFAAVTGAALWLTKNRGVRENLLIYALLTQQKISWLGYLIDVLMGAATGGLSGMLLGSLRAK